VIGSCIYAASSSRLSATAAGRAMMVKAPHRGQVSAVALICALHSGQGFRAILYVA
jgi:hypothetical protein